MENIAFKKVRHIQYIFYSSSMPVIQQESPSPIELVEGYGVIISRRVLDDAIDSCRITATRLM